MKQAELLCIGTELLLGDIVNGNARWLARQLAAIGMAHHRQVVVGDNRERLIAALQEAAGRCDVLITTGGLGPTPDDLTTEAVAAAFGGTLGERVEVWADILAKAASRGRPAAPATRRQALLPWGAAVLPNPTGTAPGMIWCPDPERLPFPVRPGFTLLTFPGVPSEMRAMWEATAAPWLKERGLAQGGLFSRELRFWGIGEATLAERVADLLEGTNPTVAPYAGAGEVILRLTASSATEDDARALLDPLEAELRARTAPCCYGLDQESLASVVITRLRNHAETVSVAESCTGGGLGAALAAVPGASDVFLGGVISYANALKRDLLGVPEALLAAHGAVSDPVALAMAEGARRLTGSTWSLAVTGVAGPGGGSVDKPVGLVHIALVGPGCRQSEAVRFGESRGRGWIQQVTAGEALNRLRLALVESESQPAP